MTRSPTGETRQTYGMTQRRLVEQERETVAYIVPVNGAYLVQITGPATDDLTPDELFSAAGSQRVARRVARDLATGLGYHGPWRWIEEAEGVVSLNATYDDEVWEYLEDGDEDGDDDE